MNEYNQKHALTALSRMETAVMSHLKNGKPKKAERACKAGSATVRSWIDGTHPKAQ